jgi:transposase-like protein
MRIRTSVRHHKSPSERASIVAAYERSQVSQREFAAGQGIALSTLQRWLRVRTGAVATPSVTLVEVPNLWEARSQVAGAAYRLCFARGPALEVSRGFDAGEVRVLAQLLREL